MALSIFSLASLSAIFLAAFLNFPLSSGSPQTGYGYQPPCSFFFRKLCNPSTAATTTTTTTTTTEYPWWTSSSTEAPIEEYPEYPPKYKESPQVNLLGIAETCAANFITQDYNEGWEEKQYDSFGYSDLWQIRLTNKLFVYLMAYNMLETNGLEITENQLEKSSCFYTRMINGWGITNTTGFGGKSVTLRLIKTSLPKVYRFALPYGPVGATAGTASIILSNNEGYVVFELCFDNGLRTFAMFTRTLGENDIDGVKLHLKAIGFKEKHFIDLNPGENCEELGDTLYPKSGGLDLPKACPPNQEIFKFLNNNALLPIPSFYWKKK